MDRKPQAQKYPPQKNYNRNYVSEPKINNDHIDTIYTNISTGEYDDIIKIIDSNNILNFRTKEGETLIHAILKNPSSSLTEEAILNIIEKLVHKNVSINSMNEYNQIPLHLAAKRGFYDIIDYLISLKSDFNKIDNYGNAPVHYLIDNFVTECKEGEYFKISNKKIKKSLKQIKYEQVAEKYLIFHLIEELENFTPTLGDNKNTPKFLLKKLQESVEQYKFFKISDINKIIATKKLEIDNLYTKHDPQTLESNTKKILYSSITEFSDLYKDFNLQNKISATGENELINDEVLKKLKIDIGEKNIKNINDFEDKIRRLKDKLESINEIFTHEESNIHVLIKILYFSYYVRIYNTSNAKIQDTTQQIIETLFCDNTEKTEFYDFEQMSEPDIFINNDDQKEQSFFIRTDKFPAGVVLERLPLSDDIVPGFPTPIPHSDKSTVITANIIDTTYIKTNYTNTSTGLSTKKCLLVRLLNILSYCSQLLLLIHEIDFTNNKFYYQYFYLNYIDEIIVNIINNFVIFKKIYSMLNITLIIKQITKLFRQIQGTHAKDIYNILIKQINHITYDISYDMTNKDERKKLTDMKNMNESAFDIMLKEINIELNFENKKTIIEKIYVSLVELKEINNDVIEYINKNYSFKYLFSLIELFEQSAMNSNIKINNFTINNFFKNDSKFYDKFSDYIAKYFPDDKFTVNVLKPIKIDLLKKYYDYDFNQFLTDSTGPFVVNYKKINLSNSANNFQLDNNTYHISFDSAKFNTGYATIFYTLSAPLANIDNKSIFTKNEPTLSLINPDTTMKWLLKNNEFIVLDESIPIVSLNNIKNIIQLTVIKIINFLTKSNFDNIITKTQTQLNNDKDNIPGKVLQTFNETFAYLLKAENESLSKKVIVEKLIIFINSYIKIQVNKEVNDLLSNITDKYSASSFDKTDKKIIENVKSQYSVQLKKYTLNDMIPKLLKTSGGTMLDAIIDALRSINSDSFISSGEKKLLLDKCVINNKIDPLKNKLSGKINLRVLDKNGNTVLNRLIDQFNEYAVAKVLEIDPEIYTYQNNRGQNSISYLYDVLNSIDKKYMRETLDKRIRTYESNLQIWIKSDESFGEIELDNGRQMIYNVILNSLYLFNECLWMILLKSPNGWKYEDKIKLKYIIAKMKKYNIKEKLLIKSLTDTDKAILKSNYMIGSLNDKIINMIKELKEEINQLSNTNVQLEAEKKGFELVDKADIDGTLDPLIKNNLSLIAEKKIEITNLEATLTKFSDPFNKKIDEAFKKINDAKLISEISMNWNSYNDLIRRELWNFYLPIMELANNKNNNSDEKYMSFYNYGLLNLDYTLLDDSEIQLLIDYNTKIINNIYGDYYDLEKYEDIEYNYINDIILNIIYLNVVNVIGIEMYSAIIQFLANKYTLNDKLKNIVNKYNDPKIFVLFEVVENLLKNAIWDKLKIKNPEKIKNYQDDLYYREELISKTKAIFDLLDNEEDKLFINNVIKFYTGLCANISYNINDEIVGFLNDLKKHSLLFGILNLIKNKSKK